MMFLGPQKAIKGIVGGLHGCQNTLQMQSECNSSQRAECPGPWIHPWNRTLTDVEALAV